MITYIKPRKALNASHSKLSVLAEKIEKLHANLKEYIESGKPDESEEYHKNLINKFLANTWYGNDYFLNTKDNVDLVIYNGNNVSANAGVIIEAKSPSNKAEMFSEKNENCKALQECVYYFMQEAIIQKNSDVKKIIITNYEEWFIFEAKDFFRFFCNKSNQIIDEFKKFKLGQLTDSKTSYFYEKCAKPAIDKWLEKENINVVHFSIRDFYESEPNKLSTLYKILSPENLLSKPFANDSNSLDKNFYAELLHIIGLEEVKESGKKLIKRKEKENRNKASLLEQAIYQLGDDISNEEKCFETALRLVITWVNRLLFLKLVESQQLSYQDKNPEYAFLTTKKVQDFIELNDLFFKVLGKRVENRDEELQEKFYSVPYLNSSLFEPTEDENILKISGIKNRPLKLFPQTVLKDDKGKKLAGEMDNLQYIFKFLDSYNFASDSSDEIQNENKTLINASVLGLIFEKINGYKDGSFFTPGFITQYMAQEAIDKAVVQKFNEVKGWKCKNLDELSEEIDDREEANRIMNSVKICDPAVGSGHFLVSALNRLLFIKSYLNILLDKNGKRIRRGDYELKLENDEITVVDEDGNRFEYKASNSERQRVQEALFAEKRTIIENCLFGVDLNPNSVYICRLRLWIELLKNTYYTQQSNFSQLETLPNIDINIKCGNSLISKFPVKVGESVLSGKIGDEKNTELKKLIPQYKKAVAEYKRESNKETKRQVVEKIASIKKSIIGGETYLFEEYYQDEIFASKIFKNSMEWMIEFPEVLSDDGIFKGFDCVIGNPPYISAPAQVADKKMNDQRQVIINSKCYNSLYQKWDLYIPFIELGLTMLCKENGIFAMIIPFPFTNQLYAKEMKKIILENYNLFNLVDLKDVDIFDNATVKNCIPFVKKCNGQKKTWISNIDEKNIIRNIFEQPFTELLQDEKTGVWNVTQEKRDTNKHSDMNVLGDFCYISYGLRLNSDEKTAKGEFVKADLLSETEDKIHCRKLIEGKDIERYNVKKHHFVEWDTDRVPQKLVRPTFREFYEYPKVFCNYLGNLMCTYDSGNKYIHTHLLSGCVLWKSLKNVENKSITSSIKKFSKLTREEMEKLSETVDLKYLLGVMNSKYASVLLTNIRGSDYHIYPEHIRNIPIPTATPDQQNEIIALVDKILEAKKMLKQVQHDKDKQIQHDGDKHCHSELVSESIDTTELEKQIDQKVYELYGLTEEEIKVVEGK